MKIYCDNSPSARNVFWSHNEAYWKFSKLFLLLTIIIIHCYDFFFFLTKRRKIAFEATPKISSVEPNTFLIPLVIMRTQQKKLKQTQYSIAAVVLVTVRLWSFQILSGREETTREKINNINSVVKFNSQEISSSSAKSFPFFLSFKLLVLFTFLPHNVVSGTQKLPIYRGIRPKKGNFLNCFH